VRLVIVFLLVVSGFAQAELLVYEGFEVADGPLAGTGSGLGWADGFSWEETSLGPAYAVQSPGLSFPGLTANGGRAERPDYVDRAAVGRLVGPAAVAVLTADDLDFWFSALVRNPDTTNTGEGLLFLFSSIRLEDDGGGPAPNHIQTYDLGSGVAVGFAYDVRNAFGGGIRGIVYDGDIVDASGAAIAMVDSLPIETQAETHLVAGHVEWGIGGTNHTLTLYAMPAGDNVGGASPVPFASPIGSMQFDLDQSELQYVTFGSRRYGGVDEIRFGSTPADVGIELITCPPDGDTHLTDFTFSGPDLGGGINGPGLYTFTATANDDSGDPILYTFAIAPATDPSNPVAVIGPQTENTLDWILPLGEWIITAEVDDQPACSDQAADAIDELQISVDLAEPPQEPPAVVYEGFDIDGIDLGPVPLALEGSGFGWVGVSGWEETFFDTPYEAVLPGMAFPGLAGSGGQAQRPAVAGRAGVGRPIGAAELAQLTTAPELWFSVLVSDPGGGNNETLLFLISSIRLEDNNVDLLHLADVPDTGFDLGDATGVGFVFGASGTLGQLVPEDEVGIRGAMYDGEGDGAGIPELTPTFFSISDATDTHLVVGCVVWGQDGTGHQLSLFALTPADNITYTSPVPLVKPAGVLQFDLDPAGLGYVTFGGRRRAAVDEIRVGRTPAEVGVEAPLCPGTGDTHCTGLTVDGTGLPGHYTLTATATDDDGNDEPILFTFVIHKSGELDAVVGPREVAAVAGQAEDVLGLDLEPGTYTATVTVDDDGFCDDEAADATCTQEIVVDSPPDPVTPTPLVYEGFEIPDLETLPRLWIPDDLIPGDGTGVGSGIGWEAASVWQETAFNAFYLAKPGGYSFPGLLSKGGFAEREGFQGRGAASRPVGTAELAQLTAPGEDMWFSVLVQNQDLVSLFETELVLLSSVRLQDNDADFTHMLDFDLGAGVAVGFAFDVNATLGGDVSAVRGVVYDGDLDLDGSPLVTEGFYEIVDQTLVHLVAGRVSWSATGTGHELAIWTVSAVENALHETPVPLGAPSGTLSFDLDPSLLRFFCFGGRRWGGSDEIRLGKTPGDVGVTLSATDPIFKRGDSNGDGGINIADAVYILQRLFAGGAPILCLDAADSNDDDGVNIADAVYILQRLFAGGAPIPDPGPDTCGPDTTLQPGKADLGCEHYGPEACLPAG
jgi:hypothetical protein